MASLLLVAALVTACSSDGDGADAGAGSVDRDPTLLQIGDRHEPGPGQSVAVVRFVDDVEVSDDVYDVEGSRYVGAEVELCGFGERRRRSFWRLTAGAGQALEAPLPPAALVDEAPALDVFAAPVDECLQGWMWFTVADGQEAVRLDWEGAEAAAWDVGG